MMTRSDMRNLLPISIRKRRDTNGYFIESLGIEIKMFKSVYSVSSEVLCFVFFLKVYSGIAEAIRNS